MAPHLLGIDIGGTKCAVCLATLEGRILDKSGFATNEPLGPGQAIERFFSEAEVLLERYNATPAAIGISCGSPLDPERGIIHAPPQLSSWKDVEVVRILSERFHAPAFLENDANACALAEHRYGAGKNCRNMVFLTFGTGMGAGLILDNRLYRGTNTYAGEVGHIRLRDSGPVGYHKAGSFEGFCSGAGIAQLARQERATFAGPTLLSQTPTARDVGEAAAKGDALSLQILESTGHYLGLGLSYIMDILNPECVVIGSIFVRCEEFLRPSMERTLAAEALSQTHKVCRIVPAGLGEQVGDHAAIAVAHEGMKRSR